MSVDVVSVCSFCVAFKFQSFLGSYSEVMNGHGIEKKQDKNKCESENYSGGGNESNSAAK
jgi:hypothetical protein